MPETSESRAASGPAILWFRSDLRLADNPALAAAAGRPILAIFIFDDESPGIRPLGGASRWWLDGSLRSLSGALAAKGSPLHVFRGAAESIIRRLVEASGASAVYWNRRYDAAEQAVDAGIKADLISAGVEARSFNSHLLKEPWEVSTKAGGPSRVFSAYWRAARALGEPPSAVPAPDGLAAAKLPAALVDEAIGIDALGLKPTKPNWAAEMERLWRPGEHGARQALETFLSSAARGYGDRRNRPDVAGTSQLSPHLRFGEISPRQIWSAARHAIESRSVVGADSDIEKFLSEIGWREFSYHLLHHYPQLATVNFQKKFDAFPWRDDAAAVDAWRKGSTGYPIVDAGMRQLWRTGWMHNRVRMIAASFFIKHLLIDWRKGEAHFWDTLVDADPANNPASWQWVAGSGADAAPYFRIFAPVLQGEKFDPEGDYVRAFVPELAKLPNAYIHKPWEAPAAVLSKAGVKLGVDYPRPLVDHDAGRKRALAALRSMTPGAD